MEMARSQAGDFIEIDLKGRLDEYWARHLARALEDLIGEGVRRIRLNLSEITYLGSAGVGVLVKYYRHLEGRDGSLVIALASPPVKRILEMAKLGNILVSEADRPPASGPAGIPRIVPAEASPGSGPWLKSETISPGAAMRCYVVGATDALLGCPVEEKHSRGIRVNEVTFGVGLGAFGRTFDECNGRFGEFLIVAGGAAYQPAYGSRLPDFLLTSGDFAPEMVVLCSLQCDGGFAHLSRFEGGRDAPLASLGDVVEGCLEIAQTEVGGIVVLAETPQPSPALVLAAGVAVRADRRDLAGMLAPMGKAGYPAGRFHGARFAYRPMETGARDLRGAVESLFRVGEVQSVQLLRGDEADLARGTCWIGPIAEISVAGNNFKTGLRGRWAGGS